MTSTIPLAVKDEHLVTLTEVQRGERGSDVLHVW